MFFRWTKVLLHNGIDRRPSESLRQRRVRPQVEELESRALPSATFANNGHHGGPGLSSEVGTTVYTATNTYSYDAASQLLTDSSGTNYSYDANGNRTMAGYATGTNNQMTNDGTFNGSGAGTTTTIRDGIDFTNNGTVHVSGGTFALPTSRPTFPAAPRHSRAARI